MEQRNDRRELLWLPFEKNGVRIYMSLAAKHEATRGRERGRNGTRLVQRGWQDKARKGEREREHVVIQWRTYACPK